MTGEDQLQNVSQFIAGTTLTNIGLLGQGTTAEGVPVDMQRFVYFMKLWNAGLPTIVSVYQSFGGVLTQLDTQLVQGSGGTNTVQIPQAGPSLQPIYRFLGSSFIAVQLSGAFGGGTSGVGVTMQIVDKPSGGM